MNETRILVVDDEEDLCEILKFNLENEGYEVDTANSAEEAMKMDISSYHLILLDVMMGEISGFKMANILKKDKKTAKVPIIFITAKDTENDTVTGFNLGADDYIPKPFNPLELVARVKAQLRRCTQYNEGTKEEGDVLDFGGLLLNRTSHECVYNEVPLTLTPIEFDILWLLCENRGKVISSEELFEKVWHEKYYKNSNNTVMVHIRHLREKMSAPTGKSDFIKTVWGVGYKVEE